MKPYYLVNPAEPRKKLPLVMVKWVDAKGDGNWQDFVAAQKQTLAHCTSVGFLLYKDKDRIVLGGQHDADLCQWAEVLTIPNTWQVKIIPLGVIE